MPTQEACSEVTREEGWSGTGSVESQRRLAFGIPERRDLASYMLWVAQCDSKIQTASRPVR